MSAAPTFAELEQAVRSGDPADPAAGPAVTTAFVAAVRGLRRLLTSDDERLVLRAAELLARVWMHRRRQLIRAARTGDVSRRVAE